jgi:uncharacterized protein YqeY
MTSGGTGLTEEAIQALLTTYMKDKNTNAVSVIKMIKTKISTEKGRLINVKVLPEAEILKLVQKEMKEIQETLDSCKKAGMTDRAAEEEAKLKILNEIMPAQLSEEEIQKIIAEVVLEVGKDDFGKVMKAVMPKVSGRADGKIVSALVKKAIS